MQKRIGSILLIMVLGMMVSCTKNATNQTPDHPDGSESTSTTSRMISCEISELPDLRSLMTDARVAITPNPKVNGHGTGAKIVWKDGDKAWVHTIFKSGTDTKLGDTVLMTIKKKENSTKFRGTFSVKLPTGLNIETLEMAGAIGVKNLNIYGTAYIKWDREIKDGDVPPMYFPLTKVNNNNGKYSASVSFEIFGSFIEMEIKNEMYDPILPGRITFQTRAFSSKGSMDLLSTEGGQYPRWSGNSSGRSVYTIDTGVIDGSNPDTGTPNKTRNLLFWVSPEPDDSKYDLKLTVEKENSYVVATDLSPQETEYVSREYNVKRLEPKKLYDLPQVVVDKGDLIISEYFINGLRKALEIYNPTGRNIPLDEYYIIQRDNREQDVNKSFTLQLGKSLNFDYSIPYDPQPTDKLNYVYLVDTYNQPEGTNNARLFLHPGKTAVYLSRTPSEYILPYHLVEGRNPGTTIEYLFVFSGNSILQGDLKKRKNSTRALWLDGTRFLALAKGNANNPNDDKIIDAMFRADPDTPIGNLSPLPQGDFARKPERNQCRKYEVMFSTIDLGRSEYTNFIYRDGATGDTDLGFRSGRYYINSGNHIADYVSTLNTGSTDGSEYHYFAQEAGFYQRWFIPIPFWTRKWVH